MEQLGISSSMSSHDAQCTRRRHVTPCFDIKFGFLGGSIPMLVISRSLNTSIRISDSVTVKVLKLGQRRVTLGVDAPEDVSVRREEAVSPSAVKNAPTSDLRVLVVEDTPVHAMMIERILSKAGI